MTYTLLWVLLFYTLLIKEVIQKGLIALLLIFTSISFWLLFSQLHLVFAVGTTPDNPQDKIATGMYHTCAITNTGSLKCWGYNTSGQLGDNTVVQKNVPTDVYQLTSGVKAVASAYTTTCALTEAGGVKCWGSNANGQIGDGTSGTNRTVPTDVTGLTSGVKAIAVGQYHSCALTVSGGVKCWGNNTNGQIGVGTSGGNILTPTDVVGLTSGVKAIAAGYSHTCALLKTGAVQCWGLNQRGQIGDNTTGTDRLVPTQVSNLTSGGKAISASGAQSCVLTTAGGMQCWGYNNNYQLGDNTTSNRLIPTNVSDMTSGIIAISSGYLHTCAITDTEGVKCWGSNLYGQLGNNTQVTGRVPQNVNDLLTGMQAISAGYYHSCGLTKMGEISCWGYNNYGQIGDNIPDLRRLVPVNVIGFASGVGNVASGSTHTCNLSATGEVRCWGRNNYGQLGDNSTTTRISPTDTLSVLSEITTLSSGLNHACTVNASGAVKCWGYNANGQIGDGTMVNAIIPKVVPGLESGIQSVRTGGSHSCALTATGGVKCWGSNTYGQIGIGTSGSNVLTPTDVTGLTSGVKAITLGGNHTCALLTTGGVKCWGYNTSGQVGDNTIVNKLIPTDVTGLSSGVEKITAGGSHTCALITVTGGVKCWGYNNYYQLGDNTNTTRRVPTDVNGLTSGVQDINAGASHTCAVTTSGGAKCWGYNNYGQLGDDTQVNKQVPTDVTGLTSGVLSVTASSSNSCAIMTTGAAKCWGYNQYGQVGDNSSGTNRLTPVDVYGLSSGVTSLVGGTSHTCALLASGEVYCWGRNNYYQSGDNTATTSRLIPNEVAEILHNIQILKTNQTHNCAVTTSGALKCWGYNNAGQIGDGTLVQKLRPIVVPGLSSGIKDVAVGVSHTCALTTTGGVKCWGSNTYGQIGNNASGGNILVPTDVDGLTSGVSAITAGQYHTCALIAATGGVKCWGYNNNGQIGDNTSTTRLIPYDVSTLTSGVSAINAGGSHTCALITATNGVKCWGYNNYGQLGDNSVTTRRIAVDVSNLTSGVIDISAGASHTCAITTTGALKCWGYNTYGQLGDNSVVTSRVPVDVSGLESGVAEVSVGTSHTCMVNTSGGQMCWGYNGYGNIGDYTSAEFKLLETPVMNTGYVFGFIIEKANIPGLIDVFLEDDESIDVTESPQKGNRVITLKLKGNSRKLATVAIKYYQNINLSNLTIAASGPKVLMHVPGGIENLSGVETGGTFELYVPKGDSSKVLVCPNADSLAKIYSYCPGGYYLDESAANVEVITEQGIVYWKVSELSGTGIMSGLPEAAGSLSRLQVSTASDHTITFSSTYGLVSSGETFSLKFDPATALFDLSSLTIADINLTGMDEINRNLAAVPAIDTWGVVINATSDTITFTAPTSGTGYFAVTADIIVKIGTNTISGTHQIINPSITGAYNIEITTDNSDPSGGEQALVAVAIIDSDQIKVSGAVSSQLYFDIDTSVNDIDCTKDACLTHGDGTVANNYTVDLGELNSNWINKSNDLTVTHLDGTEGIINSIYLDLSTNNSGGAVVYVRSANGGLAGPDDSFISAITDGGNIIVNSGNYGFNMPLIGSGTGTVNPNVSCNTATTYCGFIQTFKEVFNSNSQAINNGRLRVDIAAAAGYTNAPGLYNDTINFIVVATY